LFSTSVPSQSARRRRKGGTPVLSRGRRRHRRFSPNDAPSGSSLGALQGEIGCWQPHAGTNRTGLGVPDLDRAPRRHRRHPGGATLLRFPAASPTPPNAVTPKGYSALRPALRGVHLIRPPTFPQWAMRELPRAGLPGRRAPAGIKSFHNNMLHAIPPAYIQGGSGAGGVDDGCRSVRLHGWLGRFRSR